MLSFLHLIVIGEEEGFIQIKMFHQHCEQSYDIVFYYLPNVLYVMCLHMYIIQWFTARCE